MRFLKNKKGQAAIVALVISIVVLVVVVLTGVMILGQVDSVKANLNLGSEASLAYENVSDAVWNSINLLSVMPVVLFASAIIGAIAVGFMAYARFTR